jgi:hypothetical protein
MAINRNLDGVRIVIINMLASIVIAGFGFGGKSQT